ncbi:hypothetical protein AB1Y20_018291 [Prymnesium parvum]|uniref:Uncharacterized protein n=1 Tax=Prymnesium parvum TaxID=97485 RepID=A0AB34JP65_PRYPA
MELWSDPNYCRHNESSTAWQEPKMVQAIDVYHALHCSYYGAARYPPSQSFPPREPLPTFNCSSESYGTLLGPTYAGHFPGLLPQCRAAPFWCPISDLWPKKNKRCSARRHGEPVAAVIEGLPAAAKERLRYAPMRKIFGALPCALIQGCPGLLHFEWHAGRSPRTQACLRGRRLVMLGDSTLAETTLELLLLLTEDMPPFFSSTQRELVIEHGQYRCSFHPNQRNLTFTDATRQLTIHYVHTGGVNLTDHMGVRTLVHPHFEPELRRLGMHAESSTEERPDLVVFGATFHDDMRLGGGCNASCQCDESWPQREGAFAADADAAAKLISSVAARGSAVAFVSLFPRAKDIKGGPDIIRAYADATIYEALRRNSYFAHGGRFVDVWPVAAAYFEGTTSTPHQYAPGPSSLHYSPISVGDRFVEPDFVEMKLQLLLHALCHDSAAKSPRSRGRRRDASSEVHALTRQYIPPCGVGAQFFEQAHMVRAFNATCSCGRGMSITWPHLCAVQPEKKEVRYMFGGELESYGTARQHIIDLLSTLPLEELEPLAARAVGVAIN